MLNWPSLYYHDISKYLSILAPEFIYRLETEYKLGKAYRYFSCDFVREIFYHPVSESSFLCLLKCKVVPSQRTSTKPYEVWAIIEKDLEDKPGGKIYSAYCTCTAGLHGGCNHIVAMLFKIESAAATGATNPSKTSQLCTWNVPSGSKVNVKPKAIEELTFTKCTYTSGKENNAQDAREKFMAYLPSLYESHNTELDDKSDIRAGLYSILSDDIRTSCLAENIEGMRLSNLATTATAVPLSLPAMVENFSYNKIISVKQNINQLILELKLDKNDITLIKNATINQAQSPIWYEQRKARITASNFHRVYTRSKTLMKEPCESAASLVREILKDTPKPKTYAMKHGLALEPHAKHKFKIIMCRNHKRLSINNSGFYVMEQYPYLGASPDLEASCDCCGKCLVEIKCPFTAKAPTPNKCFIFGRN